MNPKKASQSSAVMPIYSPKSRRSNSSAEKINENSNKAILERQMNSEPSQYSSLLYQFHTNRELFIKNRSRTNDTTHSNPNEGTTTVSVSTVTVSSPELRTEPNSKINAESTSNSPFSFVSHMLIEISERLENLQKQRQSMMTRKLVNSQ